MRDRPTPETDAASWVETNQANALTLASFSRKLERERDEAREALEFRRGLYKVQEEYLENANARSKEWSDWCVKYKSERDEARKEAEYYKERYEQLKDQYGR